MERWRDRGGARVRFSGGIARRKCFADGNGGNCGDVRDAICDRIVARCQQRVSQQFQRESTLKRVTEGRIGAHGGKSKAATEKREQTPRAPFVCSGQDGGRYKDNSKSNEKTNSKPPVRQPGVAVPH